jgi:divalent metal cation (Fe/Co/Zn/Cd) transporter
MLDCLFDAVITAVTIITLGVSQITDLPIDAIIGLAVSCLIIWGGINSTKENINLLLGSSLDIKVQRKIETIVAGRDEFIGIKSIMFNDFGVNNKIIVIELLANPKLEVAFVQKAADKLSLELEKTFDEKIVVYWNSP